MKRDRRNAYIALTAVAALWGSATVVIKATLPELDAMTFLYFRFLVLIPFVIPWYIWYFKKHPIKKQDMPALTVFSFLATAVFLSLIFIGIERTTALDASILGTLTPVFIVLLGAFILKEKVTRKEKLGLFIAVLGSLVMVIQPLLEGDAFAYQNTIGNLIILSAGLIWAYFTLISKKNFKHFSPMHITLHGAVIAFICYTLLVFVVNGFSLPPLDMMTTSGTALFGVLYMAFASYILAYFLYEYGMSKIEISEGSVFSYLAPLFTAPLAILFLGESVTIPFLVGAAIIAIGVVLSEWK